MQAIDHFERYQKRAFNATSLVNARGWSGLFNGFAGESSEKLRPVDYLPFPEEVEKNQYRIRPRTAQLIAKLIRDRKLPPRVISAAQQFDEINRLLK